jgi:hypothetical protein
MTDLSSAYPQILDLYEQALNERQQLRKLIAELSAKSNHTVHDCLCLALYRQQLSFREPPLPNGIELTAASLWQYWAEHWQEYKEYQAIQDEIETYLFSREERKAATAARKLKELELYSHDPTLYVALYPIIEERYRRKSGRPVERPLLAVQGLQLQLDEGLTLKQVTAKVCDCKKAEHADCCEQNLRQSMDRIKRLLRRFRIKVSGP